MTADRPRLDRDGPVRLAQAVGVVLAAGVVGAAIALHPVGATESAARVVLWALVPLAYLACGIASWSLTPRPLIRWLLIGTAVFWTATSWRDDTLEAPFVWPLFEVVDVLWIVLANLVMLVYPSGRFEAPFDRTIVSLAVFGLVGRAVVILTTGEYGVRGCDCRPNGYVLWPAAEIAVFVDDIFRLGGLVMMAVVTVRAVRRWQRFTPAARHIASVTPVSMVAWLVAVSHLNIAIVFGFGIPEWLYTVYLVLFVIVPLSYLFGLRQFGRLRTQVTELLVTATSAIGHRRWEQELGAALHDPSLRLFLWDPDRQEHVTVEGVSAGAIIDRTDDTRLLRITTRSRPLAVIVHDAILSEDHRLLGTVGATMGLAIENDRLRIELARTLDQVRESRRRIVEAGDIARRKLERDLHDGSQQQLVSLAISLRMAASAEGTEELQSLLDSAQQQLRLALAELRELARGIHPTLLTEGGLQPAIEELARRSAVPTRTDVDPAAGDAGVVDATIYFLVAECLTNTAKHARATEATVAVSVAHDMVTVVVSDDGTGGANTHRGSGLRGITDRVEAVGGSLSIASPPAGGTTVTASIPVAPRP